MKFEEILMRDRCNCDCVCDVHAEALCHACGAFSTLKLIYVSQFLNT